MAELTPADVGARTVLLEGLMRRLGFETTVERGRDALDWHECSVVAVLKALQAAWDAGRASVSGEDK
jgi:hypothetical protein